MIFVIAATGTQKYAAPRYMGEQQIRGLNSPSVRILRRTKPPAPLPPTAHTAGARPEKPLGGLGLLVAVLPRLSHPRLLLISFPPLQQTP